MDLRELRELFRNVLPRIGAVADADRHRALREVLVEHPAAAPFDGRALIGPTGSTDPRPHVLIAWISDLRQQVFWYAVPETTAAPIAADLELCDGLCFTDHEDCYGGQWRAVIRLMAALGAPDDGLRGAAFNDAYLTGEDGEPRASEVEAVQGILAGGLVKKPADLDRRFSRFVRVQRSR